MTDKKANKNNAGPLRRAGALVALTLLAATGGCSLFGSDSKSAESVEQKIDKEIWHMRDMYVRLEAQDAPKGGQVPPNQHPVTVSPDQLYNAFSQITIKTNEKAGYVPLFTEFELGTLSQQVATGLAQATPTQDVTFAVIGWHKGGGGMFGISTEMVTTGRVFYQNGQVNLILGDAHRPIETGDNAASNYATAGDRRLDPFVPGMRSFTQPHKWKLAAAPSSGVYGAPGGTRSDWLVFSAQALAAPPPVTATRPGAPSAAEQARYEQLRKQVDQLQQQLQSIQQQQGVAAPAQPAQPAYPGYQAPAYPGYPAQPAYPGYQYPSGQYPAPPAGQGYYTPPTATQSPPGQAPSGGGDVQQRLMVLDDLKNKGLISDAEYQQKRNDILSGRAPE
jgi:hypothetical protein